MNIIDIIIIILIIYFLFRGYKYGLINELISSIALLLSAYIAINFSVYAVQHVKDSFNFSVKVSTILSFALVFLCVLTSLKLAGFLMTKLFKKLYLGTLNKIIGSVFGGLKAVIIIVVFMFESERFSAVMFNVVPQKYTQESLLYSELYKLKPLILNEKNKEAFDNIKELVKKETEQIKDTIE